MTCGIYLLQFNGTDKVYVGKSFNIESRYSSHLYTLRKGAAAKKLQEAYALYSEPTIEILEPCDKDSLNSLEKQYIKEFDSLENGFNSSPGGEAGNISPGELNGRALGSNDQYISALELLVNSYMSVERIAEATGLTIGSVEHISSMENHTWLQDSYPELYEQLKLTKTMHRNKRIQNAKRKYNAIVSPDGTKYDLKQVKLADFCMEHRLTESKLSQVLNGHTLQHKGWHTGTFPVSIKKHKAQVISPEGKVYDVEHGGYTAFAKAHGMDPGAFRKLISGSALSHHGWRLSQ